MNILWLVAALAAPLAPPSLKKSVPPAVAAVIDCRALPDAGARLVCFDRAAEPLARSADAGDLVLLDRTGLSAIQREAFGLALPGLGALSAGAELDELDGVLKHAQVVPGSGLSRFELEDGSVWRQISGDPVLSARPGTRVRVNRGTLGSFWLRIEGKPSVKVHRES